MSTKLYFRILTRAFKQLNSSLWFSYILFFTGCIRAHIEPCKTSEEDEWYTVQWKATLSLRLWNPVLISYIALLLVYQLYLHFIELVSGIFDEATEQHVLYVEREEIMNQPPPCKCDYPHCHCPDYEKECGNESKEAD